MDQSDQTSRNPFAIERRNFVRKIALGSVGALSLSSSLSASESGSVSSKAKEPFPAGKKVLMKVGCQTGGTTVENLEFKARHGVFNLDGGAPAFIEGVGWDLNDSLAKKEACEKYNISLDAYHLPLSSDGINKVKFPNIMMGKSPERDREIEMLHQMISVAGKTGIQFLNYKIGRAHV